MMNLPQLAYQLLIGGAFFAVTLWAGTRRVKGTPPTPSDALTVRVLLLGLAGLVALYAAWILAVGV